MATSSSVMVAVAPADDDDAVRVTVSDAAVPESVRMARARAIQKDPPTGFPLALRRSSVPCALRAPSQKADQLKALVQQLQRQLAEKTEELRRWKDASKEDKKVKRAARAKAPSSHRRAQRSKRRGKKSQRAGGGGKREASRTEEASSEACGGGAGARGCRRGPRGCRCAGWVHPVTGCGLVRVEGAPRRPSRVHGVLRIGPAVRSRLCAAGSRLCATALCGSDRSTGAPPVSGRRRSVAACRCAGWRRGRR